MISTSSAAKAARDVLIPPPTSASQEIDLKSGEITVHLLPGMLIRSP